MHKTLGFALMSSICIGPTTSAQNVAPVVADTTTDAIAVSNDSPPKNRLPEDTPSETQDGAKFVAPKGWLMEKNGSAVVLTAEGDSQFALIDVPTDDADEAVAIAWQTVLPDKKWPLKVATDRPGREGWDSAQHYSYEISPILNRFALARAFKRGDASTVVIIDMDVAVLQKRIGELMKVLDKLQPPGFKRESFAGKKAHRLNADRVQKLKDFIESQRAAFDIPGVAMGLYQNGEMVFEGGFGVRELGKPETVDSETLFMVASNTKSMTTLLLATLVDEGKLTWETPVTEVMADFKLGDSETTQQVRVEHLVCACTGLPRQDMEWIFEFKGATPKAELELLGTFQPTSKFGEMFQYSNLLAAAGGFVAASMIDPDRELGAGYDAAMRQRIFGPIGMTSTTFDFAKALSGNHASPHAWTVDARASLAKMDMNYAVVPVRPAGGAWSNVKDMMKYLRMELQKGALPNGKRIASEQNVLKRRETQIMIGNETSYGLGLQVESRWGIPVVHHGGSMFGYKSDMIYLPDHDVAAVILTNSDEGGEILDPFRRRLLEVLFDGAPEADEDAASAAKNIRTAVLEERSRLTIPADIDAGTLAKRYTNDSLGSIEVVSQGNELWLDMGEWQTAVASRKNDDGTISLVTISPGFVGMPFVIGIQDDTPTLTLRDAQHDYLFVETK